MEWLALIFFFFIMSGASGGNTSTEIRDDYDDRCDCDDYGCDGDW